MLKHKLVKPRITLSRIGELPVSPSHHAELAVLAEQLIREARAQRRTIKKK